MALILFWKRKNDWQAWKLLGRKERLKDKLHTVYLYTVSIWVCVLVTLCVFIINSTQAFVSVMNLAMTHAALPWWWASPHCWVSSGCLDKLTYVQAGGYSPLTASLTFYSSLVRNRFPLWNKILLFIRGLRRLSPALTNWREGDVCTRGTCSHRAHRISHYVGKETNNEWFMLLTRPRVNRNQYKLFERHNLEQFNLRSRSHIKDFVYRQWCQAACECMCVEEK